MQFQFEPGLPHQLAAIEAVCGLFAGQEVNQSTFTVAPAAIAGELALAGERLGYGNRLRLLDTDILANLRAVQEGNALPVDDAIRSMDFTVEMETGTGKTYAYLRTVFELNRRFGFSKFLVVVPSVAIREGVKKQIEQTRDHFRALYDGVPFSSFVYDSSNLSKVRDFATASTIQVMVATIQSLSTRNAIFQQVREQTGDIAAVEWVADTRPIIIVDEPQSVDANPEGAGRRILTAMRPLAMLRYSATHADTFHQVFRLDAFDAHDQGLVKSIEVDGAHIQDADASPYVKLLKVEARRGGLPRAWIELGVQQTAQVARKQAWVNDGDDLQEVSRGRNVYADIRIGTIDARTRTMQLVLPGEVRTMDVGDDHAGVDPHSLERAMVRRTVEHHFRKELRNKPMGIKTLSLFFVNKVADYRTYDDAGAAKAGRLATVFEEEYRKLAAEPRFRDTLFAGIAPKPAAAHNGYFSQDKQGRFKEPTLNAEGEFSNEGSRGDAERAFTLIMKDKERLLDEAEPLRFLFSHSALREGWDNPNVFQICALREMHAEGRRRQSIGRGLRLCVDNTGQRRRDEGLNVLTVVSEETFAEYARNLQGEMEQALGVELGWAVAEVFAGLRYPLANGGTGLVSQAEAQAVVQGLQDAGMVDAHGKVTDVLRTALAAGTVPLPPGLDPAAAKLVRERLTRLARTLKVRDANKKGRVEVNLAVLDSHDFQELWKRISRKTTYRLDFKDDDLVKVCARTLADMPDPGQARVTFELATVLVERSGVTAERVSMAVPAKLKHGRLEVPDLLGELQNRTDLPRKVLARMLVDSGRLDEARINPAAFVDACAVIINAGKRLVMVNGIQYKELDESWFAQELFVPEQDVSDERLLAVTKCPVDHITYESETVEKPLALDLEASDAIRVFAKLPRAFRITTPLGTYNPDWAIVRTSEEGQTVYLVAESKSSLSNLRDAEKVQIACGTAHFKALAVPFIRVKSLDDVLTAVTL